MATTRLMDAVIPAIYRTYGAVNVIENTALWDSGIVRKDPLFDTLAGGDFSPAGGIEVNMPFWNDLSRAAEANYSTDNPADIAVPQKITSGVHRARRAFLNNGWSTADLVTEIAGSNPMERIKARTDAYWAAKMRERLIATALGVFNDNVADNGSDMVTDISIQDGNAATDANKFGFGPFVDATAQFGDKQDVATGAIIMHSVVYANARKQQQIEFIPDANTGKTVPTYNGRRVIVSDEAPVVAGTTSGKRYISMLFGEAAFGWGEGSPLNPVAVVRNEDQGNGAGVETLWERKTWVIHPFGYSFESAVVTGQSPTNANLQRPENWRRVLERKAIPVAFLVTNG